MTTNRNYDYLIKLLLIGDSGTGPLLYPRFLDCVPGLVLIVMPRCWQVMSASSVQ
jgi:hypothetical protein